MKKNVGLEKWKKAALQNKLQTCRPTCKIIQDPELRVALARRNLAFLSRELQAKRVQGASLLGCSC